MKHEIRNGAILDIPTVAEITDPINALLRQMGQGAHFVRPIVNTISSATGSWQVSIGPADGFLWSVMSVTCDPGNTNGSWNMYVNNTSALSLVGNTILGNSVTYFGKSSLILKGTDTLIINSVAAGAINHTVGAMIQAIEVPFAHEAQLLM